MGRADCSVWLLVVLVAIISLIGSGMAGILYLYCSYDGTRAKKDAAEPEPVEEEHDLEAPPQRLNPAREDLPLEVAEKPSKVPTRVWPPPRKQRHHHPKPHQAHRKS